MRNKETKVKQQDLKKETKIVPVQHLTNVSKDLNIYSTDSLTKVSCQFKYAITS